MMMIAELFFIVDLLKKRQLMVPPSISPPVVYDPDYDWRLQEPKVDLQVTGEGQRFRPPITIDPTKIDYGQLDWKPDYKKGKF
jgi:hypothetical protein